MLTDIWCKVLNIISYGILKFTENKYFQLYHKNQNSDPNYRYGRWHIQKYHYKETEDVAERRVMWP